MFFQDYPGKLNFESQLKTFQQVNDCCFRLDGAKSAVVVPIVGFSFKKVIEYDRFLFLIPLCRDSSGRRGIPQNVMKTIHTLENF